MHEQVTYLMEEFKIPFKSPYCPEDWKDWYHYILYDPSTNIRLLYNLCFTGRPGSGYVTDTCFLTVPRGFLEYNVWDPVKMETFGFARNISWEADDLQIHPMHYRTNEISFSIKGAKTFLAVNNDQKGLSFSLSGESIATPVYLPELAPYGNGFIGWGVIPGFAMKGVIQNGDKKIEVNSKWYCYHDRNFGRFNWGNIGWVWFVLNASDERNNQWTYVLHRSNDNRYKGFGAPILFVYHKNKLKKVFIGDGVKIDFKWAMADTQPPVLPGAMASVFSDRSLSMPKQLIIRATDEKDFVYLKMNVDTHTEMIVPDNEHKQYTFLKELSGKASTTQFFGNKKSVCKKGFFYAEHVH